MSSQNPSYAGTIEGADERRGTGWASSLEGNWPWLAIRGVFALIFGILALLTPLVALVAVTLVFGVFALADGITSAVMGLRYARRKAERWWSLVIRGVLGIVAGLVVLFMPFAMSVALVIFTWVMLSLWALFAGAAEVAAALRLRREEGRIAWLLAASGVASVLLGAAIPVLLAANPGAGIWLMGLMLGFYAIASGILLLMLAYNLRKAARARTGVVRGGQPGLA